MDTNGSIRSSGKHGQTGFRPIPIQPALLATAKQFLESFLLSNQGFLDIRIRQHLHPEKADQILGKQQHYILANEQKFEPGFLCIMKGHPIVFLQSRLQYGFSLRLRIHPSVYQKEAIFIGTMDTVEATLRLEDVWLLHGDSLLKENFTKRFEQLHHFFKDLFVQDSKLSNCSLKPAEFYPLSDLKRLVDSENYLSIDFIAEQGGKRRWHLPLPNTAKPVQTKVKPKPVVVVQETQEEEEKEKATQAKATKVANLPDTYDLFNEKGKNLGRAAVQAATLSMKLREAIKQQKDISVRIDWNEEFGRYKIIDILS